MLKWINKKKNRKGFTLVELVVVIAILGVLAGIAVPRLSKSRINAAITAHNANVRTLESVATMAIADNNTLKGEWNGEEEVSKDYIQEWPNIPGQLKGKTFIPESDGENIEIKDDEIYKITFQEDGTFTVEPRKIKEELKSGS